MSDGLVIFFVLILIEVNKHNRHLQLCDLDYYYFMHTIIIKTYPYCVNKLLFLGYPLISHYGITFSYF